MLSLGKDGEKGGGETQPAVKMTITFSRIKGEELGHEDKKDRAFIADRPKIRRGKEGDGKKGL